MNLLLAIFLQADVSFEEKRLTTIAAGLDFVATSYFSPDGRRAAYVARKDEDWYVVVNDKAGANFKGVSEPCFSSNGKSVAYAAFDGRKECVVWGEKRGQPYDAVGLPITPPNPMLHQKLCVDFERTLLFAGPDAAPVYVAQKGAAQVLVVGDKEGEPFDEISVPLVGPDGSTIVYAARKGEKCYLVTGTKKSEPFDYVGLAPPMFPPPDLMMPDDPVTQDMRRDDKWLAAVFSSDGKRLAYLAYRGGRYMEGFYLGGGKPFTVVDGKKGAEYDDISELSFSPDGKTFAFWASDKKERFVVIGDQRREAYDREPGGTNSEVVWSPDGKSYAYSVSRGKKQMVVLNGKAGRPFDEISTPFFAPDGKTLCYYSRTDSGSYTFVMGEVEVSSPSESVSSVTFSPDGKSYAYAACSDGKFAVVVGGKRGISYGTCVIRLQYSPDGRAVAYVGSRDSKEHVIVGEKEYGPFDRVKMLTFSPDGKKLAFAAVKEKELWWKVVNVP